MTKNKGWVKEPKRHSLASRGIKTGQKTTKTKIPKKSVKNREPKLIFKDKTGNTLWVQKVKKPVNGKEKLVDQYSGYNDNYLLNASSLDKLLTKAGINKKGMYVAVSSGIIK